MDPLPPTRTLLPHTLNVEEVHDPQYPFLDPTTSIGDVRRNMIDYGLRILPLADEKTTRIHGVVHRHSLLQLSSSRLYNNPASTIAEEPRITAEPSDNLIEVVRRMLEADEWYTIVHTQNHYLGVMGLEHVIAYALNSDKIVEHLQSIPAEQVMTTSVVSMKRGEPVYRAWQQMLSRRIAALPVVDEQNRIVGVIAEYDLLKHGFTRPKLESERPQRGPRVDEVMSTPPVTVEPDTPVYEAALLIVRRNIGRVYVADTSGLLLGVVDREDIVRLLAGQQASPTRRQTP